MIIKLPLINCLHEVGTTQHEGSVAINHQANPNLFNRIFDPEYLWMAFSKHKKGIVQRINHLIDAICATINFQMRRISCIFVAKYTTNEILYPSKRKCSKDTAIWDINDLIAKDILQKETAGGRSTNYELKK